MQSVFYFCWKIFKQLKYEIKTIQDITLVPSIDITPEGFILLSPSNQFYVLGL